MASLQTSAVSLTLFSAAEAFAITLFFPDYLPHNPFVWTLLRTAAVNFALFAIYKVAIYPFFISPIRHLPGPKGGYPILANGLSMLKRPPGNDYLKWMNEIPNDGLLMFRGFFYQPRLIIVSPRALSEVLVQKSYDFVKPKPLRSFLRRILGDGLIIVEGDEHRFQRKHIMPVFSFRHIKELYPMMWQKAVALTQGLEAEMEHNFDPSKGGKGQNNVVELNHWANKVTMDIIGVAGLGHEFNTLKNSDDPLVQNYEEILEPTAEKLSYFACQILLPQVIINNLPWKLNNDMKRITGNLKSICTDLVRQKREAIKVSGESHLDILSILIKSNNFSDSQLVDQLLTFLAAGHETTSSALTWACNLLSINPDYQKALRVEIQQNLPENPGSDVNLAEILESMPLLNGVCNETLRLYPTVPLTLRDTVRDTTICDTFVPKGTVLQLAPWATNRSTELWGPNAQEFKPERWIDPETGKPNNTGGSSSNYNILTFLHGPRSCIGKDFAKAELRCLVAAMVGAFEMELADPSYVAIPHGVITTKPKDGMPLRLKSIKNW